MKRYSFTGFIALAALFFLSGVETVSPVLAQRSPNNMQACPTVKLSGAIDAGFGITSFLVSPDGIMAVYLADTDGDGRKELYSASVDGSTPATLISWPTPTNFQVETKYKITSDSARVVFRANTGSATSDRLYSVPIGGGTITPLSQTIELASGGITTFDLTPDGSRAVYLGTIEVASTPEVFSVPVDGSALPVRLNKTIPDKGSFTGLHGVSSYIISPDGNRVIYGSNEEMLTFREVFSVPVDGSIPSIKLNGTLAGNEAYSRSISPDSTTVLFTAEQEVSTRPDLYSVPIAGGTPVRISTEVPAAGNLIVFELPTISPDSSLVSYVIQNPSGYYLQVSPMDGSSAPISVDGPLANFPQFARFNEDSTRLTYLADPNNTSGRQFWSVPADGSTGRTALVPSLGPSTNIQSNFIMLDSKVVYWLDPENDGTYLLVVTALNGSGDTTVLSGSMMLDPMEPGPFKITPDEQYVVYVPTVPNTPWNKIISVPITGGLPVTATPPMDSQRRIGNPSSTLNNDFIVQNGLVVYIADQETNDQYELFASTCLDPTGLLPTQLTTSGSLADAPVIPSLEWVGVYGASSYQVFLRNISNVTILNQTFDANTICTDLACSISLATYVPVWGLLNNGYQWWVGAKVPGQIVTFWNDYPQYTPATFGVTVPLADLPIISVNPGDGRIAVSWPDDPNTFWVQIWVGPYSSNSYDQWHGRDTGLKQFSCDGTTCTAYPVWDQLGKINLTVWMRAWGPGGYSTGGTTVSQWNQLSQVVDAAGNVTDTTSRFDLPTTPPDAPTDIGVSDNTALDPTVIWTGQPRSTWYEIKIHDPVGKKVVHQGWHQASDSACAGALANPTDYECELSGMGLNDVLAPGTQYDIYIRAWGPGGFSTGGTVPNLPQWNAGSFTYNPS